MIADFGSVLASGGDNCTCAAIVPRLATGSIGTPLSRNGSNVSSSTAAGGVPSTRNRARALAALSDAYRDLEHAVGDVELAPR